MSHNCKQCRIHGEQVPLKGHKNNCPFASCTCDKCERTNAQKKDRRRWTTQKRELVQCGSRPSPTDPIEQLLSSYAHPTGPKSEAKIYFDVIRQYPMINIYVVVQFVRAYFDLQARPGSPQTPTTAASATAVAVTVAAPGSSSQHPPTATSTYAATVGPIRYSPPQAIRYSPTRPTRVSPIEARMTRLSPIEAWSASPTGIPSPASTDCKPLSPTYPRRPEVLCRSLHPGGAAGVIQSRLMNVVAARPMKHNELPLDLRKSASHRQRDSLHANMSRLLRDMPAQRCRRCECTYDNVSDDQLCMACLGLSTSPSP